jgi:predicted nucleic acid-binding protein
MLNAAPGAARLGAATLGALLDIRNSVQSECGSLGSQMTRFVVDCGVVLHLASEEIDVPAEHELLAPTLLRSQTLSALREAVHRGEMPPDVALERLTRIRAMPIRFLGDAVLRRNAWNVAEQLGWAETYDAEYVALTRLQADAFVTLDAELARRVEGIVPTATIEALRTA